jgi:hypothetical protein
VIFAWIAHDGKDFSASVLSLSEREFMEKSSRDAAYKKDYENLEVFISSQIQHYDQLFVSLFFSPVEIEILTEQITSPYIWEIVREESSSLVLKISEFSAGDVDEGIVIVPFVGDMREITVEFVSDKSE